KDFEKGVRLLGRFNGGANSIIGHTEKTSAVFGSGAGRPDHIDAKARFQLGIPGEIKLRKAERAAQPFSLFDHAFTEVVVTKQRVRERDLSAGETIADPGAADRFTLELQAWCADGADARGAAEF